MSATSKTSPPIADVTGTRIRHLGMWLAPLVAVVSAVWTAIWWSSEKQRAMLRGRNWPPDGVLVLLGR